jgi:DNA-directed RNA polymerase subunit beta'
VEIWTNATEKVREAMEAALSSKQFNPIDMMVGSGARGNMMQVRQIAGMRGLVANPRGDMIPRPIKSNSGRPTMLEYFIATPGARKAWSTPLRTADSGYSPASGRRGPELIINNEDLSSGADGTASGCASDRGRHPDQPASGLLENRSAAGAGRRRQARRRHGAARG